MSISRKIIERSKSIIPFDLLYRKKLERVLASHRKVGDQWDRIISDYQAGRIEHHTYNPKQDLKTERIIWQYWGQGIDYDVLPGIVKIGFDSIDKHSGDYTIIRLSDDSIAKYLDIPNEIYEKRDNGLLKRAFFSDLLRVMLLATYGGIWLDATVLMTGEFPSEYTEGDHFCYQRDHNEPYQQIWEKAFVYYYGWREGFQVNMLNSILWAKKGSKIMSTISDLLLYFWLNYDHVSEYFFFQVLYNRLVNGILKETKPMVVSDCTPHILQAVIGGTALPYGYEDALSMSHLHKLSYFNKREINKLKRLISQIN